VFPSRHATHAETDTQQQQHDDAEQDKGLAIRDLLGDTSMFFTLINHI
jgi:hypothetical protein